MEQVATLLILKLGDGQARIREAALGALINLSRYQAPTCTEYPQDAPI